MDTQHFIIKALYLRSCSYIIVIIWHVIIIWNLVGVNGEVGYSHNIILQVGEGEKLVKALFAVARVHQPSVIFLGQ